MTKAAEDTIFVLMWSRTMESSGRYDIRFDVESYYGGLHCGECFEVKVKDTWIPVRIEMDMSDQWYLVGFPRTKLDGLRVRI